MVDPIEEILGDWQEARERGEPVAEVGSGPRGHVAAGRKPGAIVAFDPDLRPAELLRQPVEPFERRGRDVDLADGDLDAVGVDVVAARAARRVEKE